MSHQFTSMEFRDLSFIKSQVGQGEFTGVKTKNLGRGSELKILKANEGAKVKENTCLKEQ